MSISAHNIAWFKEIDKNDVSSVGGKGANLGEMVNAGFPVPGGFVVTAHAYYDFLRTNNLSVKIKHLLSSANFNDQRSLSQTSGHIKKLIIYGNLSENLVREIISAYKKLGNTLDEELVAVRSSATAEDLSNASFAGQQETFLNVKGDAVLIDAIKKGWASLFNARAIFYRHQKHFDHTKVGIALVVQKMVESEKSGVMFTIDPITGDKSKVIVEAIFGLGELIVQGEVTPDHYEVDKNTLEVINKKISSQELIMIKDKAGNKKIPLNKHKRDIQKITIDEIKKLAKLGKDLEKHYYFPQDIEWAIEANKVYIVQTRAVTTIQNPKTAVFKDIDAGKLGALLVKGDPASPGIASGPVKIIKSAEEIGKVMPGDILVAPQTNPDFVPAMKKACAIVTDFGGRTSHAAIVSRELGIPAVVGTENATSKLKAGHIVTVNGIKGEVYSGGFSQKDVENKVFDTNVKTATKLYVNLAEPSLAGNIAQKNVDGVGLLRAEFMMAEIGVHPKKMIKDGKSKQYIEKLANDLAMFCRAFDGRPVVYRASDFKTNEYKNLIGGKDYEPGEPNPMLGFRGAFRYIHDSDVFKLELDAIKQVRNKMGLKNLWVMIPFVRTVQELEKTKKIINDSGLERSPTFKIWMMVEIPSNVIMLDKFIEIGIDGVSIGSNDLTMLILGTDRDNPEVANEFDEMNPAALWAFEHTIKTAHKYNITSSMCGQAVSTYPELVKKVVEWGITSVSVSPDAIDLTRNLLLNAEKELLRR
ncbi:MAG: phosphoenolpyruvate synthase [Candidatus Levybacteria bacterium CG10_big_fil_rev_8_21_14_0_10_35_13]|nr:MAG: phosphoenolpyruvate synthase [Candidatus Levybacteria bacterium CG10_big_fil_rev_8_21_14_0_10_35_13]